MRRRGSASTIALTLASWAAVATLVPPNLATRIPSRTWIMATPWARRRRLTGFAPCHARRARLGRGPGSGAAAAAALAGEPSAEGVEVDRHLLGIADAARDHAFAQFARPALPARRRRG